MAISNNIIKEIDGLDYAGSYAEPIIKPLFSSPATKTLFTVLDGVTKKRNMPIVGNLRKITKKYVGCGLTETGDGVTISNRTIEPETMEMHISHCADVFQDTIFEEGLNKGVDMNNIIGTDAEDLVMSVVTGGLQEDKWRQVFFGDTDSADEDYSAYDGVFKKHFEGVDDYTIERYTIGNVTLTDGQAITILDGLIDAQPLVLKQVPKSQKLILVTGSIFDNLRRAMRDKEANNYSILSFENGQGDVNEFETIKFDGFTVLAMREWDTWIETDFAGENPHRAIVWAKSNHFLATNKADADNKVKIWYSDDDDVTKVLTRYTIGYNYALPELTAIAY